MPSNRIRRTAQGMLIISACLLSLFCYQAYTIFQYRTLSTPQPTDAAIVLGAAIWDDHPSPVFQARINHAIDRFHSGHIRYILFTGGRASPGDMSESEVAKHYALEHGVPDTAILIETYSTTTRENLHFSRTLLRHHQISTVQVISDPLHMWRAMKMADQLGFIAFPSPTPYSRFQSIRSQTLMLLRETYYAIGDHLRHLLYPEK